MSDLAETNVAVAERDEDTLKSELERELEAEALYGRDDADGAQMFPDGPQSPDNR